MISENQTIDSKLVFLDPFLVDRARISLGLSQKDLVERCAGGKRSTDDNAMSLTTFKRVSRKQGFTAESALRVAQALESDVLTLLAPWDPLYVLPKEPGGPWLGEPEWETVGYLEQGRLAPNGLYYLVCRMRHRHTANRQGRGKFYHLGFVPTVKREAMRHQLNRHADVCARVGVHPQLALNSSSTSVADGWWVIDHWVGERTLADHLEEGTWPSEKLPRLLHEIAVGLDALHRKNVILRELAPARILISDQDGRAVLTDFELAKLLDGSPSVSGDWPDDEFRAGEVEGGGFTLRADLYSFGRLAVKCVAEKFPELDDLPVVLGKAGVPKGVAKLLSDCQEPSPDRRPPDLTALIAELQRWSKRVTG